MPRNDDGNTPLSRITDEPRHWIEYGVFAFVAVTAIATATAAWYTRKESETAAENGRRQLRAYVFPEQANLTADQLKTVQKGTQAIYSFGEISYVDAFDE